MSMDLSVTTQSEVLDLFEYFAAINGWKYDAHITGYTWLAITLVLWLEWPALAKSIPLFLY